ncbi:hypothetical protein CMV_030331 [Castanea mollissima]|uniref:Uncharacterized protein n=1 Tax=Castanea mollissima TaxID=60419 RepID=A0A8J4V6H8_9ROSI|nr:hypothetical protein CMV_030331 [Castanea mollissima]
MKNKASTILKQIIATLSSMAKAKTLALKNKTRAIKTRLIIFSLLKNKKIFMSSLSHSIHQKKSYISHKLNALLSHHHHHHHDKNSNDFEDDLVDQDNAIVQYKDNLDAMAHKYLPDPTHTEEADVQKNDKCPNLTHSLFDSKDLDFEDPGGSVIDLVKNSKEEAGEEFMLENEIDRVADLFIKRFHKQMMMQKQLSLKRHQERLEKSA